MWGQVDGERARVGYYRIIPTRVGTSEKQQRHLSQERDHPHACGDKPHISFVSGILRGSSPRVWGQEDGEGIHAHLLRIIPTRVGTSSIFSERISKSEDHPHACGDKFLTKNGYLSDEGSSPRVWGQEHKSIKRLRYYRIIPTRVGTSIFRR